MVGTSGNQSPKGATTTLQRSGDIHDVEHLEVKKQNDFSRCGHGCSTVAFKVKEDINIHFTVLTDPS